MLRASGRCLSPRRASNAACCTRWARTPGRRSASCFPACRSRSCRHTCYDILRPPPREHDTRMTTLNGLKNCDTCKKAQNWLKRFGIEHRFVDYRDERQSPDVLVAWRDAAGGWDGLINKSSTTWRELAPNRKTPGSD